MRGTLVDRLKSRIRIRLSGRRVENFLKRLMHAKIELLDIKYRNRNEIDVTIYKKDYDRIVDMKSIYEIDVVGYAGMIRIQKKLMLNRFLLLAFLFAFGFLLFISNLIFSIEIVHNDKEIRKLLAKELEGYGLSVHHFRKSFGEIEKIKKEILEKYKDKIEWLEIENVGTKYIVKVEERKIIDIQKDYKKQHVIATKPAIIRKVEASSGVVVRNIDDYVKAGDIVISGEIKLNEEVKDTTKADGTVYGEVWYNVRVEYPFIYREEKETGKKKEVYAIRFGNHYFSLFDFKKYDRKYFEDKVLIGHSFLPFAIVKQEQREVKLVEYISTEEEAIFRAREKGRKQMMSQLDDKEHIIREKQLKVDIKNSKIVLDMFYAVYEDITGYQEITMEQETQE